MKFEIVTKWNIVVGDLSILFFVFKLCIKRTRTAVTGVEVVEYLLFRILSICDGCQSVWQDARPGSLFPEELSAMEVKYEKSVYKRHRPEARPVCYFEEVAV